MNSKIRLRDFPIFLLFAFIPVELEIFPQFSTVKLATIAVIIVYFLNNNKNNKTDLMTYWHIKLCIIAALSCLWSIDIAASFNKVAMFLIPTVLTCWIIYQSLDSIKKINIALFCYFLGCMVNAVYSMMNRDMILLAAEFADQERMVAFGQDPNMLAFLLNMGLVIAYHLITNIDLKKIYKLVLLACASLVLYVSISTGSRTGLITIALCVGIISISSKRSAIKTIPFAVIAFFVILNYLPESIVERLTDTRSQVESGQISERGDIWAKGLSAFMNENFVLGVGYQNFSSMLAKYYGGWRMASHNTYLSYLVDLGVAGIVFLLLWIIKLYKYCRFIHLRSGNKTIYLFLAPIVVSMMALDTENKIWIFVIGIMIYKYYTLTKYSSIVQ